MSWRSGDFDRTRLAGAMRPFAPAHATENLQSVDLDGLYARGKRLILLDVDHTLVQWHAEEFAPEVVAWVERAKGLGFGLCIISNTHRPDRLNRLADKLGIETVRGRIKPSRAMFRLALIKFGRKPEEAVMIGDQMMTDVLGANRSGIDAIWVRKMEGGEFGGTKVNRLIENFLRGHVYRALVLPERAGNATAPIETPLGKQILRFAVVGGLAFAVNTLVTIFLMRVVHLGGEPMGRVFGRWLLANYPGPFAFANAPDKAAAPILGAVGAFVAMFVSFVLNRAWTFEATGKARKTEQAARFYAVAIVGAILNSILFGAFYNGMASHEGGAILAANVAAAIITAAWNFLGQRFFAFRKAKP